MKSFQNILVVRTDRLGDVVLTTPAIKALREKYPNARISILILPSTYDLVNGNPYVDQILMDVPLEKQKGILGLLSFVCLVRKMRLERFDLAIIFHTKRRYNLACWLAGIPCRLGYKTKKFGFLLTIPVPDIRFSGKKHESEYCLKLLKKIGVYSAELELFVPVDEQAERWSLKWIEDKNLKPKQFIVIHPLASDSARFWPASNYCHLIDWLTKNFNIKIVLIGFPRMVLNTETDYLNLTGQTSVSQMVSLLRHSRLLISNDSGPVHVAAGVGTPVVSICMRNPADPIAKRWKPLGPNSFFVEQPI